MIHFKLFLYSLLTLKSCMNTLFSHSFFLTLKHSFWVRNLIFLSFDSLTLFFIFQKLFSLFGNFLFLFLDPHNSLRYQIIHRRGEQNIIQQIHLNIHHYMLNDIKTIGNDLLTILIKLFCLLFLFILLLEATRKLHPNWLPKTSDSIFTKQFLTHYLFHNVVNHLVLFKLQTQEMESNQNQL